MNLMPWRTKKSTTPEYLAPWSWEKSGFDRLIERFFRDPWSLESDRPVFGSWAPPVDITETENQVVVRSELPGVDPKDLSITVSGDVLTLAGEKAESTEHKGENYCHTERRFGSFRRQLQLPSHVDPDKVNAEYENGVLTVTLERKEGAAVKRIPVSLKK